MALSGLMLAKACRKISDGTSIVASMGYPDIIAEESLIKKILGDKFQNLEYRDDSDFICRRHSIPQRKIPYSESLFSLLGAKLTVFDVESIRGGEIVVDLNYPIPHEHHRQYDIVLDVGTLEHCFNIGQAAINMAYLVKVGGHIFHENPFNWGNHGFYGINPTWYFDFYECNGFKVEDYKLISRFSGVVPSNNTSRFIFVGDEALSYVMAKKEKDFEITFPTQTKYRKKHGS